MKTEDKEKSDPKQQLLKLLENTGKTDSEEFIVDSGSEINPFERMAQDIALHPDDIKGVFDAISSYIPFEKIARMSSEGIERELENNEQFQEAMEVAKEGVETFKSIAKDLNTFIENIEEIREFNKNFKYFLEQKKKEDTTDIFDIDIPDDYWEDILNEDDDYSDDDY